MGWMPEVPADAKQTNCWKFFFIFEIVCIVAGMINSVASGAPALIVGYLVDLVLFVICMYHLAYTRVSVSEQAIEVSMGPWQWPLFGWCCSSQVAKEEVVLVERKQRQCCYDVIPRLYCAPVWWCCCHKSYSAYWWPFCCNDCNVCDLCEGDSDSSDMIQINLTQSPTEFVPMCCKRCGPCPITLAWCWCCVYNRIAVSIRNESVWQEIQSCGYPLSLMGSDERTALAPGTEGTTPV